MASRASSTTFSETILELRVMVFWEENPNCCMMREIVGCEGVLDKCEVQNWDRILESTGFCDERRKLRNRPVERFRPRLTRERLLSSPHVAL